MITAIETEIEGATDVLFNTSTTIEELKSQSVFIPDDGNAAVKIDCDDTE